MFIMFKQMMVFIMLKDENRREHADKLGNQISFPYMSALLNQPNSNGLETTPVKISHTYNYRNKRYKLNNRTIFRHL